MKSITLRFPLLFSLVLSLLWMAVAHPVRAEELPADENGTIEIRLEPSAAGRSWDGVVFEAWRCADLSENGLEFAEPYQGCFLKLDQLDDPESMRQALSYLDSRTQGDPLRAAVSEDGVARFASLPYGLYLIRVGEPADFDLIGSCLVLLPGVDEDKETLKNRITISAKAYPLPDLEILKTDEQRQPVLDRPFVFGASEKEDGTGSVETKQADVRSGTVRFRLRLNQTLYIRELEAPEGYQLSDRCVKVHLAGDGALYVNNRRQSAKDGLVRIEFANQKQAQTSSSVPSNPAVPSSPSASQTGGSQNTPRTALKASTAASLHAGRWMILALASALILSGLWIGCRRRNRHTVRF